MRAILQEASLEDKQSWTGAVAQHREETKRKATRKEQTFEQALSWEEMHVRVQTCYGQRYKKLEIKLREGTALWDIREHLYAFLDDIGATPWLRMAPAGELERQMQDVVERTSELSLIGGDDGKG